MLSLDLALAFALLCGDRGPAGQEAAACAHLAPQLRALGISLEILDQRETEHVLARPVDFADDLRLLRRRWRRYRDAPPASDAQRYPARGIVQELQRFNRAYLEHLKARSLFDVAQGWQIYEATLETDRLYDVWDMVADATCAWYYVTVRREALRRLRDELLGPEAYYAGVLPPIVPIWRFARLD